MNARANHENLAQSVCFVTTLIVFFAFSTFSCLTTHEKISSQENRALAPLPRIHSLRADLPKFTAAFEPFFKDRFPFRLDLISIKNLLTLKLFRASGNPLVVVGKDNWLFYKSYGVTPAQLNLEPFSQEDLQMWAQNIIARKTFLEQHNIKFLLVLAPEKGSMYPEMLPAGWRRHSGITRLEQLQNYLRDNSDVDFVDARNLLAADKNAGSKIYHSNDTHWNQRGAFLVAQAILEHLHRTFPSVLPFEAGLLLKGHDIFTGDLAKMLGLQKQLRDVSPSIVVNQTPKALPVPVIGVMNSQEPAFATTTRDRSLPVALVLRDSFCTYLAAPLSEHFRFCEFQWTNDFKPKAILNLHPDVVINEVAERHLYEAFNEHLPVVVSALAAQLPICTFGNKLELLKATLQPRLDGVKLVLLWRTRSPLRLDYTVGVHCLNSQRKFVGGADFQPDFIQRELPTGTSWMEAVSIPDRELKGATQIGLSIYYPGKDSLTCDSANSDWHTRFVITFRDLEARQGKLTASAISKAPWRL